jgi:hypothetical protein
MNFSGGEARELERRDREKKMIQAKLKKKMLHSLQMPDLQLASEYYTNEEMTQFKKPKKKVPIPLLHSFLLLTWSLFQIRKIRKKALKASDLLASAPSSSSHVGRRAQETEKRAQFKPIEEASTAVKEEPQGMDVDSDSEAVRIGVLDLDDDPCTYKCSFIILIILQHHIPFYLCLIFMSALFDFCLKILDCHLRFFNDNCAQFFILSWEFSLYLSLSVRPNILSKDGVDEWTALLAIIVEKYQYF